MARLLGGKKLHCSDCGVSLQGDEEETCTDCIYRKKGILGQ